jgi:hypothetical protein
MIEDATLLANETATPIADSRSRLHHELAPEESYSRLFTDQVAEGKIQLSCPVYRMRRSAAANTAEWNGMGVGDLSSSWRSAVEAWALTNRWRSFAECDLRGRRANS